MGIAVIGGSGHVGSFLVPRLVRAGHEVVNLSRGARAPYVDDQAWLEVEQIQVDRAAEDAAGAFGQRVAALEAEVVVDMICFTPDSAAALTAALRGHGGHLVHCGTIWRYGPSVKQPMREDAPHRRSASTAPGRLPLPSCWPPRPDPAAWSPRCSSRATSAARAGRRSDHLEILTQRSGTPSPPARRSLFRALAPSSCTTSTPTTWRRRSSSRSSTVTRPGGVVQRGGAVGGDGPRLPGNRRGLVRANRPNPLGELGRVPVRHRGGVRRLQLAAPHA